MSDPTITPTVLDPKELLEDERSLVHRLPDYVQAEIQAHIDSHPQYFGIDETDLLKLLRSDKFTPSATDNRLRLNFWLEYDHAVHRDRPMSMNGIFHGVCTRHYLADKYLKFPQKVAWLLCPPASYAVKANEALEFGLEQLRSILEHPHVAANGKLDTKLGELKAKIVAMLDHRVKGAVAQKNLNINVSQKQVESMAQDHTMESLQRELKELEARERKSKNLPSPKEVIVGEYRVESDGEGTPS